MIFACRLNYLAEVQQQDKAKILQDVINPAQAGEVMGKLIYSYRAECFGVV